MWIGQYKLKTGNHEGLPLQNQSTKRATTRSPLQPAQTTAQPRGQPRGIAPTACSKRATTRDCSYKINQPRGQPQDRPYKINQPRGQPQGIAPTKSINQEGNHKGLPLQPAQNGQPRGLPLQNQSNVRAGFLILSLITHLVPNLAGIGDSLLARRIESVDARRWLTGTLVLGPR